MKYSDVTLYPPKSPSGAMQGATGQSQWGSTHPGAFQGATGQPAGFDDSVPF